MAKTKWLTSREEEAIQLYINPDGKIVPLRIIAAKMGISPQRVYQLVLSARYKLQRMESETNNED